MYKESSLIGSCKTGIHLLSLRPGSPGSPGRWSKAASMKLIRSCTSCLSAGAVLQIVGVSDQLVCTTVRVFKAVTNSTKRGQAYGRKA